MEVGFRGMEEIERPDSSRSGLGCCCFWAHELAREMLLSCPLNEPGNEMGIIAPESSRSPDGLVESGDEVKATDEVG